ncbi:MAG: TolC family protein, partial [Acidobacteriota bacterium]
VSQPIYAGLRDLKAKRQADIGVELARKSYQTTVQDALLAVTRAYYNVLAFQDNVDITRHSVEVAEETLRSAESLYRAGESVETAVLRGRVAYTNARRELLEVENGLRISKQQLALLAGVPGDFRVLRPDKPDGLDGPLDELIKIGLRNRRELQSLELERDVLELEIQRLRGQYLPVV